MIVSLKHPCSPSQVCQLLKAASSGSRGQTERPGNEPARVLHEGRLTISWSRGSHDQTFQPVQGTTQGPRYVISALLPDLNPKTFSLLKEHRSLSDQEHYLELLMRISGGKRLSLPSPNPADSPLVRCGSVKIAQKAAKVINETKKKSEGSGSS